MTSLTSYPRLAAFVLSEANGQRSRENIVVTQSGTAIKSGTVLAKQTVGSAGTFVRDGDATGNFTSSAVTVGVNAKGGVYTGTFTAATTFTVTDPSGVTIGNGSTSVEFTGGGLLGFTITAGETPAVEGDKFTVTVVLGTVKYIPYTVNDGAGNASAILYSHLPADTGDVEAVGFVRDCEVRREQLVGIDNDAAADLLTQGIVVRTNGDALGVHTPAL